MSQQSQLFWFNHCFYIQPLCYPRLTLSWVASLFYLTMCPGISQATSFLWLETFYSAVTAHNKEHNGFCM
ncbi:hypothetical protein XENTR_v10017071 [Xenopus tropicalis]|nr:hypothetical protein XENTR_v10017071 [Xenopus tropicalis]